MSIPFFKSPAALSALLCVILSTNCHAEIHRWTDNDGKIHFSDKPPGDVESTVVEIRINTYETPSIEGLAAVFERADKIVMYATSWCGVCRKARSYFRANGIAFTEFDVENSARGKREFKRLGGRGVPVILVGKKRLNGFNRTAFESIYGQP